MRIFQEFSTDDGRVEGGLHPATRWRLDSATVDWLRHRCDVPQCEKIPASTTKVHGIEMALDVRDCPAVCQHPKDQPDDSSFPFNDFYPVRCLAVTENARELHLPRGVIGAKPPPCPPVDGRFLQVGLDVADEFAELHRDIFTGQTSLSANCRSRVIMHGENALRCPFSIV